MEVNLTNRRVVAVDGGTATGKSRLVEELANVLRLHGVPVLHVSSGHLYRVVAYAALRHTGCEEVEEAVKRVHGMEVETLLMLAARHGLEMHNGLAWIDGAPALVDEQLKAPGVGATVSYVSSFLPVRELVNVLIRRQVNEFDGYVLIDGRDITHTVVPDAPLKLLLVVRPEVAAERSREHTVAEVVARDTADRKHPHGALRHPNDPGEGVVVVATDDHTPESARDEVYGLMRRVFGDLPAL